MPDRCDQHYVVVATKPASFPGAYASCVMEPEYLPEWAFERLAEGATLQRVTCNESYAMLKAYMAWSDAQ